MSQTEAKALEKEATYRKQIEDKKKQMDEEYNNKISQITLKIKSLISNEAKKQTIILYFQQEWLFPAEKISQVT